MWYDLKDIKGLFSKSKIRLQKIIDEDGYKNAYK